MVAAGLETERLAAQSGADHVAEQAGHPQPRAVDLGDPQRDDLHAVERVVHGAEQLTADLGDPVRGRRPRSTFSSTGGPGQIAHGALRGEVDYAAHARCAGGLVDRERALGVGLERGPWQLDRHPRVALAGGVDDAFDAVPTQCLGQAGNIEQLALHDGQPVAGIHREIAVVADDLGAFRQ